MTLFYKKRLHFKPNSETNSDYQKSVLQSKCKNTEINQTKIKRLYGKICLLFTDSNHY